MRFFRSLSCPVPIEGRLLARIERLALTGFATLLFALLGPMALGADVPSPPNIVFILADNK
jgi:hypothetical protein